MEYLDEKIAACLTKAIGKQLKAFKLTEGSVSLIFSDDSALWIGSMGCRDDPLLIGGEGRADDPA
jgi:hypothetical protein